MADLHLGYQQFGSEQRANDMALMLHFAVERAINQRVDFVLVAGDLFHKHNISPQLLHQVTELLKPLSAAGIPLLAVIGNHDNPTYADEMSWLDYLSAHGSLILLDAQTGADGFKVVLPWDGAIRRGTYIDLHCGARVVGMRYYGASTARMLEIYLRDLRSLPHAPYTILMLHTGLEGMMDAHALSITRSALNPFRELTDYVALGHFHKPFIQDDWLYNPGSLETVSSDETAWPQRGLLQVSVEPGEPPVQRVEQVVVPRRPYVRVLVRMDTIYSAQELLDAIDAQLLAERLDNRQRPPVVEVTLTGVLQFDPSQVDEAELQSHIRERFRALVVRITNRASAEAGEVALPDDLTRSELERHVLTELISRDVQLVEEADAWAALAARMKERALAGRPSAEIVDELEAFLAAHPAEADAC